MDLIELLIFQDPYLVVINKPTGVFVHRSEIWGRQQVPLLQQVRDFVGFPLFPIHRLDRPTSGLVMFGTSRESASAFGKLFQERQVTKTYAALVRGYSDSQGEICIPLPSRQTLDAEQPTLQDARTRYQTQYRLELPFQSDRYSTTRCSLIHAYPHTGRWHQIRRHMNRIHHPILGDTSHGDNTQNRFFRVQFSLDRLLLAAIRLEFTHPFTGTPISLQCSLGDDFEQLLQLLNVYRIDSSETV